MTREEAKDTASEVFYASHGLVYPVVAKPYTDDMVVKEKFFTKDDMVDMLDKIRAEIEKAVWEDVIISLDGTDEIRIPLLEPDDVFEIIDKYKAESEGK